LQRAAEDVENGIRVRGAASFAANIYDDPMLETPEFVEVRRRLGFPNLVDR
jgi:hypothetical protein